MTEKKRNAIRLLAMNRYSNGEISKIIGVNQNTLSRWKNNKDFTKELENETRRRVALEKIDRELSSQNFKNLDIETLLRLKKELSDATDYEA